MPQRTFSLSDEASQKLDRMAEQEDRTLTAVLNRIIMQGITEEQIKAMRDRFLGWELPKDFNPDNHIQFYRDKIDPCHPWPSGTNLFDACQAEVMIRYIVGCTISTPATGKGTQDGR